MPNIGNSPWTGSLFSNQELAIAYAIGFDHILVVNQNRVAREGILGYIGVNTEMFEGFDDCYDVVQRAIDRSGWKPDYCRRLTADRLYFKLQRFGNLSGWFLLVDISNGRRDIAAEATARLSEYGPQGGSMRPCEIRIPLKATARPGFSHTIFPKSQGAFDLLCVGTQINEVSSNFPEVRNVTLTIAPTSPPFRVPSQGLGVYLNSASDVFGAGRLEITPGVWLLRYEFHALGFPLLSLLVELTFKDSGMSLAKIISQDFGL